MGSKYSLKVVYLISLLSVMSPAISYSQGFTSSRATYYGSPDCLGTPSGACGFGEYGRTINDANVAGVSRLYKNGTGCGGCYQVRCKVAQVCTNDGVNVVVTDYGEGDKTDFILSTRAYGIPARANAVAKLFAYGVVDVEFRRIPCQFSGYNIMFKVHEQSRFSDYLAIVMLYQNGQSDILDLQIWLDYCKEWVSMRRAYGAVWDMANPPKGSISFRFQASGSAGTTWVEASNVIPDYWKAGAVYDSQIQLN